MLTEKVIQINHWSDRTFSFKTTRSESFRFNSGEFAMIGQEVDGKRVLRAYSIVSPSWADYLEFLSIKDVGCCFLNVLGHYVILFLLKVVRD
jgi:ferredoxin--NADP+ reductase